MKILPFLNFQSESSELELKGIVGSLVEIFSLFLLLSYMVLS